MALQSSQTLSRISNFTEARIGVFPEGEEFLIMLYGFVLPAFQLDMLIIPTAAGSSFAADHVSVGHPTEA